MMIEGGIGPESFEDAYVIDLAEMTDTEGFNQINLTAWGEHGNYVMAFFPGP